MKRLALVPFLLVVLACPRDKEEPDTVAVAPPPPADTTDLSGITANIPEAAPDTFKRRTPPAAPAASGGGSYPNAPAELMAAVEREQSFSRFCFQEFGQKADPSLAGNVAMLVTVGSRGITDAKVADANWTSSAAGTAVNRCLNERAKLAWKLAPGAVRNGRYVVQLSFRGA
jgi:hypothetical protein